MNDTLWDTVQQLMTRAARDEDYEILELVGRICLAMSKNRAALTALGLQFSDD